MQSVVIYGAGGLGCQVEDFLQQHPGYRPAAFLDSNPSKRGLTVAGLPVRGGLECIPLLAQEGISCAVVAVGDCAARVALAESLRRMEMQLVSAIHPLATISPSAKIGQHVIIGPRATVCVHSQIGDHVVMLAGAIAEHDNRIERGAFIGPAVRLAGTVTVGKNATLEIGSTVIPGRTIGRGAHVTAGAVVIQDVPAESTAGGVPALAETSTESNFVSQVDAPADPSAAVEASAALHAD